MRSRRGLYRFAAPSILHWFGHACLCLAGQCAVEVDLSEMSLEQKLAFADFCGKFCAFHCCSMSMGCSQLGAGVTFPCQVCDWWLHARAFLELCMLRAHVKGARISDSLAPGCRIIAFPACGVISFSQHIVSLWREIGSDICQAPLEYEVLQSQPDLLQVCLQACYCFQGILLSAP